MMNSQKNIIKPKRTLAKIFILSAFVFYGVSVFGPWQWHLYSVEGLIYFVLIDMLFLLGLMSGIIAPKSQTDEQQTKLHQMCLSNRQKKIVLAISLCSVLCWIYEMFQLLVVNSGSFVFMAGAGQAEDYLEGRTVLDQIALIIMQLGVGSYILFALFAESKTFWQRAVVNLGFWAAAIYLITYGQRFALAVTFIIFIAVWKINGGSFAKTRSKIRQSRSLQYCLIAIACLVLLAIFFYVFNTRLHVEAPYKYEFIPGDMALKPFWQDLYNVTDGGIDPLLMLADYMGESPFVFSGNWVFYQPDHIYWCYQLFRPIIQFASIFDFPSYMDIVNSINAPAKYSGLAYSLMLNFGVYLAPFASYLIGFMFSEIESYRGHSYLCSALYPCCVAATVFAPIYFITVGRLDYVVYGILLICFLVGKPVGNYDCLKYWRHQA